MGMPKCFLALAVLLFAGFSGSEARSQVVDCVHLTESKTEIKLTIAGTPGHPCYGSVNVGTSQYWGTNTLMNISQFCNAQNIFRYSWDGVQVPGTYRLYVDFSSGAPSRPVVISVHNMRVNGTVLGTDFYTKVNYSALNEYTGGWDAASHKEEEIMDAHLKGPETPSDPGVNMVILARSVCIPHIHYFRFKLLKAD